MASPTTPYNWADDKESGMNGSPRQQRPQQQAPAGPRVQKQRTVNVNFNSKDDAGGNAGNGGNGGGGNGAGRAASGAPNHHQGDGMISAIERIEFNDEKDILACAKAVNRLGRELHFILSMHAEEIQGVLSTYKGRWYTFGAQSRIKARLVAMHLKVSAEAAKALGVGALKMAHAFDRHFVKPEQEAKRKRNGQKARREFTIGGE
ncbi:hypothetical protein PV383_43960 [Streptomyces caniscabiei]|uniref:Uncharacterized protein n=1 Tax=Streptomyces caniscabiei TaxID=2746961 RepID=A0ABU4N3E1_9ACTN|nr:hypothetical protein [Streptomyces caniscabiei]MDX3044070.1 hypothetical protein [Streptomyces caniscabiei]